MKQSGYTLFEILLSTVLLMVGSGVLWYSINASSQVERLNRLHHHANRLAQTELESLRIRPRAGITDTTYEVVLSAKTALLIVREVFDSAKIVETLPMLELDENYSPTHLRRPLEVRVRVWEVGKNWFGVQEEDKKLLTGLSLMLPEYRWY